MDATTSDIPRDVSDIIVDLDLIQGIPTNHKLNTLDKTYIDADSYLYSIIRSYKGETGEITIDFINLKIDEAIKICQSHPTWADLISEKVSSMSGALLNLENVYKRKKKQSVVSGINLLKIRIDKDRFLRACQTT